MKTHGYTRGVIMQTYGSVILHTHGYTGSVIVQTSEQQALKITKLTIWLIHIFLISAYILLNT
jgi:hypothetical protein